MAQMPAMDQFLLRLYAQRAGDKHEHSFFLTVSGDRSHKRQQRSQRADGGTVYRIDENAKYRAENEGVGLRDVTETQPEAVLQTKLLGGGRVDEDQSFVVMAGGHADVRLPLAECQRRRGAGAQFQRLQQCWIDAQDTVHLLLGDGFGLDGDNDIGLEAFFHNDSSRFPGRVSDSNA